MPKKELQRALDLVSGWLSSYWWLVVIIIIVGAAYLYATYRYWYKAREATDTIRFAPISVRGGISNQLGSNEAALLLHAQLSTIVETFNKDRTGPASIYVVTSVSNDFRSLHAAFASAPSKIERPEVTLTDKLVVNIGPVRLPVGDIVNLFLLLPRIVPVPFRRRYLASLVNVSLVSIGDETQLLVYRRGQRAWSPRRAQTQSNSQVENRKTVLTRTRTVRSLTELNDLLRDAVFMAIELHGQAFPGRTGQSMRYYADGLDALDEYRRTGDKELVGRAEEVFSLATAFYDNNYEALYFYGSLLWIHRTQESITRAIWAFNKALKTDKLKLKALVHAGLANCYAQKFHRLAEREEDILKKAQYHADNAKQDWKSTGQKDLHPWIFSTLALVQHKE